MMIGGEIMDYIAHAIEGTEIEQKLIDHLQNTAKLSAEFAKEFNAEDWGYICGLLHDIGKYSDAFQKRIRNEGPRVDHSTAGAKEAYKMRLDPVAYCIAGHHSGMPDTGELADGCDSTSLIARLNKFVSDYSEFKKELVLPTTSYRLNPQGDVKQQFFILSVFTRMLFSCLVDADFLDTEFFMNQGEVHRKMGETLQFLQRKLMEYIQTWLNNEDLSTVNGHRSQILRNCIEQASGERGFYKMTMPTGSGKTIASLAFALNHALKNNMKRIIYVIPYTSIIDQNAKVFKDILGKNNVLENHSQVEFKDTEELKMKQLASENWDAPIVVTTNVQFFESLFSNRSSKCRKLHNIANSVIIFDEVQMLPVNYLKPCVAMMEELVRNYKCTEVLCTATQPVLDSLFSGYVKMTELCPNLKEQFEFFKRNTIQDMGDVMEEDIVESLKNENRALCIVNTRKRAQMIYNQIKGEGVYHLSTTMYPQHRIKVISEIKNRLKDKKKCVVISTSLVEAGVDFDFQNVYREIAGLDSILQAAGRCNREGKELADTCNVYVFCLNEKVNNEINRRISATKTTIEKCSNWNEPEAVHEYFETFLHYEESNIDQKGIMDQFKEGLFNFKQVAQDFKLIESDTYTILIPIEDKAREVRDALKFKGYTKELIRQAGHYSVQVYDNDFKNMYGAGMLREVSDSLDKFYELVDLKQYTEEMGLSLNIGSGEAIMM